MRRTDAVITQQQHAGFRGGDRSATDWSSTGAIIEQRESRAQGIIKFIIIIIIIIIIITIYYYYISDIDITSESAQARI